MVDIYYKSIFPEIPLVSKRKKKKSIQVTLLSQYGQQLPLNETNKEPHFTTFFPHKQSDMKIENQI